MGENQARTIGGAGDENPSVRLLKVVPSKKRNESAANDGVRVAGVVDVQATTRCETHADFQIGEAISYRVLQI